MYLSGYQCNVKHIKVVRVRPTQQTSAEWPTQQTVAEWPTQQTGAEWPTQQTSAEWPTQQTGAECITLHCVLIFAEIGWSF